MEGKHIDGFSLKKDNFRIDINGLRAWAVVGVLLFHFPLLGMPGGFVGVDVFFVISGYLMTDIIVRKLMRNEFNLVEFYLARARRILPALSAVVVTLLIMGWFWLPTPDYQELGKESAFSMAFLSNIGYWRTSGYFDSSSHEKWLLHTWSLSVEAQFYIIYPLIIMALWKVSKNCRQIMYGLLFITIILFLISVRIVDEKPTLAFYFLPTRSWELLAGGLVCFFANDDRLQKYKVSFLMWVGLLTVIGSFLLIDSSYLWPGFLTAIPVVGTCLILFVGAKDCTFTNNNIAQWLGYRSYSLYLWHWPLIVALYFTSKEDDWLYVLLCVILSVLLSHISFHLIENPSRELLNKKKRMQELLIICCSVFVVGVISVLVKVYQYDGRFSKEIEIAANGVNNKHERHEECFMSSSSYGSPGCVYGEGHVAAILLGDSHAGATIGALEKAAESNGLSVVQWGLSACPPIFNAKYPVWETNYAKNRCVDFNQWAFDESENYSKEVPIILLARLSSYLLSETNSSEKGRPRIYFSEAIDSSNNQRLKTEFRESLIASACQWSRERPVYLVRPIPEMDVDVPKFLSRRMLFLEDYSDISIEKTVYMNRHEVVWNAQNKAVQECGVKILDPSKYLCDEDNCFGSSKGVSLYYDDDHLNEYGNELLIPMFEKIFINGGEEDITYDLSKKMSR